ncbi:MAG: PQQ-binding-like beta-propeller repeat protein [Planctomycetota bacterium]|nr:PQQ-binding-like beta-propeller repeat protein [Planctomycetota bacterium]
MSPGIAADKQDTADESARHILDTSGVKGGLVVHVGADDGRLTAALRADDRFLVHGIDRDAGQVAKAREYIHSKGGYGVVSVDVWRGGRLPYVDNIVNLLVVEDTGSVSRNELLRVLAPRGKAFLREKGKWTEIEKPLPAEIDEWTHYLHAADNNAVAKDKVVGPPRHYQWIAGPKWARSHDHLSTTSALVSSGGRIFYIIDEGPTAVAAIEAEWSLVARDAFSGVLLWKKPVSPWEGHLRGFRSGPTELARRLVARADRVYVTLGYGKPVTALDAATGETVATYKETTGALELILHGGTLFIVVGDRPPDNTGGAAKPSGTFQKWNHWPIYRETPPRKHLVALRADTGRVLWTKDDADTHEMMPTTLAAAGRRLFFHSGKEIFALVADKGEEIWRAARPVNLRRPSWSAPTLVVSDGVVLCADRGVDAVHPGADKESRRGQWVVSSQGGIAPEGKIQAFEAASGKPLWDAPCKEVYNSPVDVLVADGLVWSGKLVRAREPGITKGLDLKTGRVARERPDDKKFFKIVMNHHRCYRNKATEKFLVLGRDGTEFIDVATGKGYGHAFVRGACQYGVMPCNGLLYSPPHSCACHIESKLDSFVALAPARTKPQDAAPQTDSETKNLEKGPAYDWLQNEKPQSPPAESWPTYRHDAARSGKAGTALAAKLMPAWSTDLGAAATQPVVAGERVVVATPETHAVHALNTESGKRLWTFTTGAAVDSPPTFRGGAVIFGSADGWIYCLRARDGELAWRYRAAPRDRRCVAYGRVESLWPLHGSVLLLDDVVYAVAGRCSYLDGGMRLVRIDARTGKKIGEKTITGGSLPDVLSSDGTNLFLRHRRMDKQGNALKPNVPHLYSAAGFLDGSWWHRTYWQIGTFMRSAYGGWPITGSRVPAGRILVTDGERIFGFGRLNQYTKVGGHVGLGRMKYLLYALPLQVDKIGEKARRRGAPVNKVPALWTGEIPILARGMSLCGETLFVAGPPNLLVRSPEDVKDEYHIASVEALRRQREALSGKKGARLLAVSAKDGGKLMDYKLDAPPVWDGLSAAHRRLFVATTDGRVSCLKP